MNIFNILKKRLFWKTLEKIPVQIMRTAAGTSNACISPLHFADASLSGSSV